MFFRHATKAGFSMLGQDLLYKIAHLWQGAKEGKLMASEGSRKKQPVCKAEI